MKNYKLKLFAYSLYVIIPLAFISFAYLSVSFFYLSTDFRIWSTAIRAAFPFIVISAISFGLTLAYAAQNKLLKLFNNEKI